MSNITNKPDLSAFHSFIESNQDKLDEAMVSLRLMKEIDDFLIINEIQQKELSHKLNYSTAYISQLMTGTKKFNTSFINKFEKSFNVRFHFQLVPNNVNEYISKISNTLTEINFTIHQNFEINESFNMNANSFDFYEVEETINYND